MMQKIDRSAIRLTHLDVLRGFALFGILLVNFEWFSRSTQAMLLGSASDLQGIDRVAGRLIVWLAESKFFPLFSMLFGMGFAMMVRRAQAAGRPFVGLYLRRLLALEPLCFMCCRRRMCSGWRPKRRCKRSK